MIWRVKRRGKIFLEPTGLEPHCTPCTGFGREKGPEIVIWEIDLARVKREVGSWNQAQKDVQK